MIDVVARSTIAMKSTFDNVRELLAPVTGKECCTRRVGRMRSLSVGFGSKNYHGKVKLPYEFYGEWEVRTYNAAWRVVEGDSVIVCASGDSVGNEKDIESRLNAIEFGQWRDIEMTSKFDLQIKLTNDIGIHFFGATSEDDELFHIRCPESLVAQYSLASGWKIGKSNSPWK